MNRISFTPEFKRRVKPLAKKHHTLKDSIDNLGEQLLKNPLLGDSYGSNLYKIRLADQSKGKGKSGGFRVMYYLIIEKNEYTEILLITIFDKSELDTIKKNDAQLLLKKVLDEIETDNPLL